MNDIQFEACYKEALETQDKDAYLSDMALSIIWEDEEGDDVPQERLAELGCIWDVAHMNMLDIRKSAGLTQAAFGRKFLIPKRTIGNWECNVNTPPEYVKVLIARAIGLC